jgi:hypothetical protein
MVDNNSGGVDVEPGFNAPETEGIFNSDNMKLYTKDDFHQITNLM